MKYKIMYSKVFVLFIAMNSVFIYIFLYSVVQVTFIPVISDCYKKMRCHSTHVGNYDNRDVKLGSRSQQKMLLEKD